MILSFQTSKPLTVATQPFRPLETTVRYPLGLQFCNENVLSFTHDIDRIEFNVPSTELCTGADGDLRSITSYKGLTHLWSHLSVSVSFEPVDPGNASDHGDKEP